uniref:Uncharacterized protein n=1 Tax=Arundo donax TaxID=35708 RepID=A0A0A8YHK6_ARUDO
MEIRYSGPQIYRSGLTEVQFFFLFDLADMVSRALDAGVALVPLHFDGMPKLILHTISPTYTGLMT